MSRSIFLHEFIDIVGLGAWPYMEHTRQADDFAYVAYPKADVCKTGTVALVSLAIIDYLRADRQQAQLSDELRKRLDAVRDLESAIHDRVKALIG